MTNITPLPDTVDGFLEELVFVHKDLSRHAHEAQTLCTDKPLEAMFHQSLALHAAQRLQDLAAGIAALFDPEGE